MTNCICHDSVLVSQHTRQSSMCASDLIEICALYRLGTRSTATYLTEHEMQTLLEAQGVLLCRFFIAQQCRMPQYKYIYMHPSMVVMLYITAHHAAGGTIIYQSLGGRVRDSLMNLRMASSMGTGLVSNPVTSCGRYSSPIASLSVSRPASP